MRKGFIFSALKNKKITLFLAFILAALGVVNYLTMPKQEDPNVIIPVAIITTVFPGASPGDVERLVTNKIEDEIAEIDGYDFSDSDSKNGLSVIVLFLEHGADTNEAWVDLRRKMDDLQGDLPSQVRDIQINTDVRETAGIIISLSGPQYSHGQLVDYAEKAKKELSRVEGIARFDLAGQREPEVAVEIDAAKLNFYQLSMEDILKVIQAQNVEMPSGALQYGDTKIAVKTPGAFSSIEEIKDAVLDVSADTGGVVRLGDIADIRITLEDASFVKRNGQEAVLVAGYFKQGYNIVAVGREVAEKLTMLKKELPDDVKLDKVVFQPDDIDRAVRNFTLNLLEGILFVIVVVFIGMGLRNAIVVSTAIPLSVLVTFVAMGMLGIKIHQISIAALLIALGMLVDNAIVVSDAIQVKMDDGVEKMEACLTGVREVAIPVLSSTLTTVAVFLPLLMLNSMAGDYVISIPQIVSLSLAASYLVAILVTPAMAYVVFKPGAKERKTSLMRKFYRGLINKGMNKKLTTIVTAALIFAATLSLATGLGLQFFPKADKDVIYINIDTEQSDNLNKTEIAVDQVTALLEKQPEIIDYTAAIGNGIPKFYDTLMAPVESDDFGQVLARVDLGGSDRFDNYGELIDFLQNLLDENISGATATAKQLEKAKPIGAPVRVRILGPDLEQLKLVSQLIQKQLSAVKGAVNVRDDAADKIYQYQVDIDAGKASRYGLSKFDVQQEVSIALMGRTVSTYRAENEEYDIVVNSNIKSKEQLENFAIKSRITGNKVLLKEIANISLNSQITTIKKYDRQRSITIYSDVLSGYSSAEVQNELKRYLDQVDLTGVTVDFAGEMAEIEENFGDVGVSASFAIMLVYTILLLQFGSFRQPLLVLFTIPLAAAGSIMALYLFRQPLSFTALLGVVSLLGIVVNNAIILVDYINNQRLQGQSVDHACRQAVDKRLRPIILSTTTTAMGLFPLAINGGEMFRPLAIALMGGLLVSTLLTLVVIPVGYSLIERQPKYFSRKQLDSKRSKTEHL